MGNDISGVTGEIAANCKTFILFSFFFFYEPSVDLAKFKIIR